MVALYQFLWSVRSPRRSCAQEGLFVVRLLRTRQASGPLTLVRFRHLSGRDPPGRSSVSSGSDEPQRSGTFISGGEERIHIRTSILRGRR